MMDERGTASNYKGLGRLLYIVRWSQHLLAIIAEVLILLSFAMSGMDVSLGGVMAGIPWLKVLWAAMFALGIDTAFALSWVRVRQCVSRRQWGALVWNMLLALSMSLIIFQPIAVQLLQQTLNISFNQAIATLGINIVLLTYARSAVAIFLGAILAMTNVEDPTSTSLLPTLFNPKRRLLWFVRMAGQPAPTIGSPKPATPELVPPASEPETPVGPSVTTEGLATEQVTTPEQPAEATAQPELLRYETPEQRAQKVSELDLTDVSAVERVAKILELFPDLSDRELGKLSGMAAATAKKYRDMLKTQAAKEDG